MVRASSDVNDDAKNKNRLFIANGAIINCQAGLSGSYGTLSGKSHDCRGHSKRGSRPKTRSGTQASSIGCTSGAMHSFRSNEISGANGFSGQIPGHFPAGSLANFLASNSDGPFNVAAGVQQLRDDTNNHQKIFNVNAMYELCRVKLYAGWRHSQNETG
ncbi:hypothetical protein OKW45_006221 [Paraburkholderia sp. WSM4175]|uniref:hypothetical protein n=1 Tax=Paraburkholderia sp. WSM4175 TaxID=2991072 RepID=UPI003D245BCA